MSVDRTVAKPLTLIPENAPFTPAQRAWLNGFFAGLLAEVPTPATVAAAPKPPLTVLYASQTGTAEGLAKKLVKAAKQKGFAASARELGSLDLNALASLGHVGIIASTYGEGEPPDNAKPFGEMLNAASGAPLAGLSFAVLALGDRNYTHFCRFGAALDARLAELGGKRLVERMECDVDVDAPFAHFRDGLLAVLEKGAAPSAGTAAELSALESREVDEDEEATESWTRERPYRAQLLASQKLNGPASDKDTRHVVLSLKDSGIAYDTGDALGVLPENAPEAVAAVLDATGLDGAKLVTLGGEATLPLADALTRKLAIGKLAQPTLIKFQAKAESATLARLLEPDNDQELSAYLWGRELIDLLTEYPGVVATAEDLVSILPKLAPRLYSISSSRRLHPDEVHLTVAIVRYESHGRRRHGIASSFLADRTPLGWPVSVYLHRNPRFRLPDDPHRPIVMIGPGTGIAPFRAFLQERRAVGAKGKTWLFFGERRTHDFLYRQELQDFRADGTLTRLDTAFSREGPDKVYVQHRMLEFGDKLWRWICDGAHLYVCGDVASMARDVHHALQTIIMQQGRFSEAKAKLELQAVAAEGRYARDVY